LDEDAREISRGHGGPSNHQSVGVEAASKAIADALATTIDAAGNPPLAAACWGMAGLDRPEDEQILKQMAAELQPQIRVEVVHDSTIALVGGTDGKRVGVVIISGTGSIAVGYHPSGRIARASGWGHLLGDEGSGYFIALRGLNAATRAHDGRGPTTTLVDRLPEAIDVPKLEDLANRIYLEGWTAPEVAALAPVVLKTAEQGDEQALAIVTEAGMELALAARVVIEELGMVKDTFEVVLSGGIFKGSPRMVEIIQQELGNVVPHAEVILPRHEPVIGAGLIALEAVGLSN
jgi:N-acetylglucosamine kinase